MFDKFLKILRLEPEAPQASQDHKLALATAALMVQVSVSDGHFSSDEQDALMRAMTQDFALSPAEARRILEDAVIEQEGATCLYRFTRALTRELDQEGRQEIVRALWRVALADGVVDNFEDNVVARIAGLLGVVAADRIRIKQEVQAQG